jgi:hypothetical protein
VPGRLQIGRHGAAHDTEANETDLAHLVSS